MSENEQQPPTGDSRPQTEIRAEEIKALFTGGVGTGHFYFGNGGTSGPQSRRSLIENLAPSHLRPFKDPRHDEMRAALELQRILLLKSYQESAAYAAAYSLISDPHFDGQEKKAVFPTRAQYRDRSDLDLLTLADDQLLETPQIILVEISNKGPFLDSMLRIGEGEAGSLRDRLQRCRSYVVIVVDEDLFIDANAAGPRIPCYAVSHLCYLLSIDFATRAEDLERRLLGALRSNGGGIELRELYQHVADRIAKGAEALEGFLSELEQTHTLRPSSPRLTPDKIIREGSEIHRAVSFVATYFPDLGQRDFDLLLRSLLGDQIVAVERTGTIVPGDSGAVRHDQQERWADRWTTGIAPDQVFDDCHLETVVSSGGSRVIDFTEPYLRRELRTFFENRSGWYVRRQCQALQDRGILFSLALSPVAVEALVRLFVERAVGDSGGFGSIWLIELVQGLRLQLDGDPPTGSREATLAWLLDRLALEAQLRAHFYGRLALLIREMLDREVLRPMVREFFEFLIASRQHETLLDVVLDLARRLRFAPHFDPLIWMRRLLDQGTASVRERAADRLIKLARDSGPRIYEFLDVVRSWLPDAGRAPERFSVSNRVALEFPFAYCLDIAGSLPKERFGEWPSRHPLFYSLPADREEARKPIGTLVEWILDPRGAALETGDSSNPTRTAEAVRLAYTGDLIEHWAWVLQGGDDAGAFEARALFRVIAGEIEQRLGDRQRALLKISWQRRQDEYMMSALSAHGVERTLLFRRRARLEQLRRLFLDLEAGRQTTTTVGAAP